ncbi:MAG: exodeoxyribonuclease V subunit alpha [Gammaproteobacteria bacterium]|nr:exodeoxyribonuclease V subunit alpha [Gammaproteobacteria bacterium]
MSKLAEIKKLAAENKLDYCHYTLARFIDDNIQHATEFCLWLSVLVNVEINRGNVCLDVSSIPQKSQELGWINCPKISEILPRINSSPVVGEGDELSPLIFENNKLYLNRYYHNEKNISESLLSMTKTSNVDIDINTINNLFAGSEVPDYQKLAAIISCKHQLSIISGGPGTGKTWTVSKILTLLILQQKNNKLKIKLAAPTGKAAARLSESIEKLRSEMNLDDTIKKQIPGEAVTLHRLLGIHRYTHRPGYHQLNPLSCDVLVLDEASMIDQQMMAVICAALPAQCKLILLGDKDQLSSVEAGSVFADLCGGLSETEFNKDQQRWIKQQVDYDLPLHRSSYSLSDHVVVLQKSHRFDEYSGIGLLAKSINQGDVEQSINQLKATDLFSTINWSQPVENELPAKLKKQAHETYLPMLQAESISEAFKLFHQFQILSAVWSGPTGVDTINSLIESYISVKQGSESHAEFYKGKPVMMTSNVYLYDIHNGDIGIVWPDENEQLKIWFEQNNGKYRKLSLSQCPEHKTAYAMTVHKSQGSEFKHILLILPYTETAVSTRELFYTGITRAAESVEIWGSESIIKTTINQKTLRVSGLMERLKDNRN